MIRGAVSVREGGRAVLFASDGSKRKLPLPQEIADRVLDNDRIAVTMTRGRQGQPHFQVSEIEERPRQFVVGTYAEVGTHGLVTPIDSAMQPIRVAKTQLARPGDAVKVRLLHQNRLLAPGAPLEGEVAGALGQLADHSIEVLSIAYSHGFSEEFPPEVMEEAARFPPVDGLNLDGREDLRRLPLVTIDGADARDFDDAVYAERTDKGFVLWVAVADVSHYVHEGSVTDREAYRRATSVYLPGRVLPMLPERLSNDLCSLLPHVDRYCMAVELKFDDAGRCHGHRVVRGLMKSAQRLTYDDVHRALAGEHVEKVGALLPMLKIAHQLAQRLHAMRVKRGALDFELPETKVRLGANGLPEAFDRTERFESHRLVEECMLAANEAVARDFGQRQLPTMNRYHGPPDPEKLDRFARVARAFGISLPKGPVTPTSLGALLDRLKGHAKERVLNQLLLRSMMQAVYSSTDSGHFGLAAPHYLHFTSPIRRYPDLVVHRLLNDRIRNRDRGARPKHSKGTLDILSRRSSEQERAAMQVEREVTSLYAVLMVKDRLGEEFDGIVSGLSEGTIFVELVGLNVEGGVRPERSRMPYEFDPDRYSARLGSGRISVGDPLRVKLVAANIQRRQIDLDLVNVSREASPPSHHRPPQIDRLDALKRRMGKPGGGREGKPSKRRFRGRGR